jgi:hypothetical protein
MNYYYLDANNQPVGPAPLDEIHRKAAAGLISANPMIAPVGTTEWQPLAGGGAAPATGFQFDRVLISAVAAVLRAAGGALSSGFINASLGKARQIGHYAVTVGGPLGLVYAIYIAVKAGSLLAFISGAALVLVLSCVQFAAARFFSANETLLANTPSRISSPALLECVGLLALLGTVLLPASAIVICVQNSIWQPLVPALLAAIFWLYFAAIALHPESVNITVARGDAGEEAIGLAAFLFKAMLKILPLLFGLLSVLGCLAIALSFFGLGDWLAQSLLSNLAPLLNHFPFVADHGFRGLGLIILSCLLPFLGYVAFILASLPLDLWRALLAVLGKLDALKR